MATFNGLNNTGDTLTSTLHNSSSSSALNGSSLTNGSTKTDPSLQPLSVKKLNYSIYKYSSSSSTYLPE